MMNDMYPTVFHVTHWKAGSQWLYKILREIALDRIVSPILDEKQFLDTPLIAGAIYPTVYVTRQQFYSVRLPANYKKFIVLRDLRDTLISGYFSIRYSHAVIDRRIANWRERLCSQDVENGLMMLMDEWLPLSARIQESWVETDVKYLRYEDMLTNDAEILKNVLIEHCEINVPPERLYEVVTANRFEKLTGGRRPGDEDRMAHERKGVPGDWKNHFTPRVADLFNERYGKLLANMGYEPTW